MSCSISNHDQRLFFMSAAREFQPLQTPIEQKVKVEFHPFIESGEEILYRYWLEDFDHVPFLF